MGPINAPIRRHCQMVRPMLFESMVATLDIAPVQDGKLPGRIVSRNGRSITSAPNRKADWGGRNCKKSRVATVQSIAVLNPIYPLRSGVFKGFTI